MSATQFTTNLGLPQFQTNDIPTWDEVNSAFAKVDSIVGAIAPKYDATATYTAGDIVQYNGGFYKAKADIDVAEEWTPAHWDTLIISTQLESTDLTNFVKYDSTSGTGLTNAQFTKLAIN